MEQALRNSWSIRPSVAGKRERVIDAPEARDHQDRRDRESGLVAYDQAGIAYNVIDVGISSFFPDCSGPTCVAFDLQDTIGLGNDGVNGDGEFVVPALDVIGTASGPEPGTCALLLAGLILLTIGTRRRRARHDAGDARLATR
jgi:hypothetical protein